MEFFALALFVLNLPKQYGLSNSRRARRWFRGFPGTGAKCLAGTNLRPETEFLKFVRNRATPAIARPTCAPEWPAVFHLRREWLPKRSAGCRWSSARSEEIQSSAAEIQ